MNTFILFTLICFVTSSSAIFSHLTLNENPIGLWQMKNANDLSDMTGNNGNITTHLGSKFASGYLWPNLEGLSMQTGGYVVNDVSLVRITEAISISVILVWQNNGNIVQNIVLIDGTNDPWGIYVDNDGFLTFYWSSLSYPYFSDIANLIPGIPTLIQVRRTNIVNGSKVTFAINGIAIGVQSGVLTSPTKSSDGVLLMGQNAEGYNDFNGGIASLAIYDRELTDEEWLNQAQNAGFH